MIIGSPIFVLIGKDRCWLCEREQKLICLASPRIREANQESFGKHEFKILRDIRSLPGTLVEHLREKYPYFHPQFSKTAQETFYVNHCECREYFVEQFLHEPGGTFAPLTKEARKSLSLRALTVEGEFEIEARLHEASDHTLFSSLPVKESTGTTNWSFLSAKGVRDKLFRNFWNS